MVTVVDARTFEKLIHTVNAVAEQVVYADLLVINKCDAVDPARIHAVESAVRELNSSAAVRRTEFGALPVETLPDAPTAALRRRGPRGERYAGWDGKKPVCRTWNPPASLSRDELLNELQRRMHTALRIKGFVETRDGPVFVSATPENVEMRPMERLDGSSGLTEFYPTAPKEENQ
jgi:G3E family GTPase